MNYRLGGVLAIINSISCFIHSHFSWRILSRSDKVMPSRPVTNQQPIPIPPPVKTNSITLRLDRRHCRWNWLAKKTGVTQYLLIRYTLIFKYVYAIQHYQ